ncbi:MAG: hypothetical protein GY947_06930 [Rhodobacteraceae bacterium]|nr:hypothetical protein [Paracoccaceae bacterium]
MAYDSNLLKMKIPPVFFGAAGANFRGIKLNDAGHLVTQEFARAAVELVSGSRDTTLEPTTFDAFIVVAGRMQVLPYLYRLAEWLDDAGAVSEAVLRQGVADFLLGVPSLNVARVIASLEGAPDVGFLATPFHTRGEMKPEYVARVKRHGQVLSRVLDMIGEEMAGHNIRFVPQPEETVADRFFTRNEFAVGAGDLTHKTPQFAAIAGYAALSAVGCSQVARMVRLRRRDLAGARAVA